MSYVLVLAGDVSVEFTQAGLGLVSFKLRLSLLRRLPLAWLLRGAGVKPLVEDLVGPRYGFLVEGLTWR
jgi:hypothetical protein